jgi:hypothetical protein
MRTRRNCWSTRADRRLGHLLQHQRNPAKTSGQARGEIVDWVDPVTLSATLYSQYISATIDWANHKLDDDALQATTSYGHALILLGVARGRAVAKLEALAWRSTRRWSGRILGLSRNIRIDRRLERDRRGGRQRGKLRGRARGLARPHELEAHASDRPRQQADRDHSTRASYVHPEPVLRAQSSARRRDIPRSRRRRDDREVRLSAFRAARDDEPRRGQRRVVHDQRRSHDDRDSSHHAPSYREAGSGSGTDPRRVQRRGHGASRGHAPLRRRWRRRARRSGPELPAWNRKEPPGQNVVDFSGPRASWTKRSN